MVTIKNNFSIMFHTHSHKVYSNLRCQVSSAPRPRIIKTTRYTASPNEKYTMPPATKLSTLPVREWEEKMKRLNDKYGLNYFSDFEFDSESDEGEEYRYEHKYETLI